MFFVYTKDNFHEPLLDDLPRSEISTAEGLIILGGDGTLLSCISSMQDPPLIFGVNYGTLGFLMQFSPAELPAIIHLLKLKHEFKTFKRKRLLVNDLHFFLNEAVISSKIVGRLNKFELFVDDEFVSIYFCDSVIISTSTGSGAYNHSAGGPYLYDDLDAIILTLVSPFKSLLKTMVFGSKRKIKIMGGDVCILDGIKRIDVGCVTVCDVNNYIQFACFHPFKEQISFERLFGTSK